jgi:thiol-disulfide isomerase/thioredoxin
MKFTILSLLLVFFAYIDSKAEEDPKTLTIGAKAPNFNLKGIDNKMYNLESFKASKFLVVVFTCNHCPTAQAYEDRLIAFQNKYKSKGVRLVAINPNSDKSVRFDELGYSDLNDGFSEMKIRAKDKKYNFTYLFDGNMQVAAKAYGPTTTPQVFVFDNKRILKYVGRIDNDEHVGKSTVFDLDVAINELIDNKEVTVNSTKTFGCSVKWLYKNEWKEKEVSSWKNEPVSLEKATIDTVKNFMKNGSGKYRLINFWATWCGPCVGEFSSLVETDKMYRAREFELITVSLDAAKTYDKTLGFLKKKVASNKNYIFGDGDKYALIEAVDPNWGGALPYSVILDNDGKIVYRQSGMIDILELRKAIVEKIGRVYP